MSTVNTRQQRLDRARDVLVRASRQLDVVRRRAKQAQERNEPMEPVLAEIEACLAEVDDALTAIDELIAEVR